MPISRFCPAIAACVAFLASAQLAVAQQPTAESVPPTLEKLEEGEAPPVTTRGADAKPSIVETRERGQVTSIRVQRGNSTYYLKPAPPAGSALRDEAQRSATTRAPQWRILEFDWKNEPEKSRNAAAQDAAGATPPPPASTVPQKNQ